MSDEPTTVRDRDVPAPARPRGEADVSSVVWFADFEFDFERDLLRRDGVAVPLSPKPGALLRYMLSNPRRILGRSELMASLWAGVVVTEDSLFQCVSELRSRLGDEGPKLITTHPRRGYMFEADVRPGRPGAPDPVPEWIDPDATTSTVPSAPDQAAPRRGWRALALALALGASAIAGGAIYMRAEPYRIDAELGRRYSIVVTPFQDIGSTPVLSCTLSDRV